MSLKENTSCGLTDELTFFLHLCITQRNVFYYFKLIDWF